MKMKKSKLTLPTYDPTESSSNEMKEKTERNDVSHLIAFIKSSRIAYISSRLVKGHKALSSEGTNIFTTINSNQQYQFNVIWIQFPREIASPIQFNNLLVGVQFRKQQHSSGKRERVKEKREENNRALKHLLRISFSLHISNIILNDDTKMNETEDKRTERNWLKGANATKNALFFGSCMR